MFRPNLICQIARCVSFTPSGKRLYGTPTHARCAIVTLQDMTPPTSVRTDSSASKGAARDETINARLLLPASTSVLAGDRISVLNYDLSVQTVFPRHNVFGRLDHYQVDCEIWKG